MKSYDDGPPDDDDDDDDDDDTLKTALAVGATLAALAGCLMLTLLGR